VLDAWRDQAQREALDFRALETVSESDPMTEFEGVVPALGQALTKREYTVLTPVQNAVLAPGLMERDLLVSAQTGSGKTVAFGIALAPTLLNDKGRFEHSGAPTALAVAPTRELALQVKRELEWLYELTGASLASCVGGMDMRTERRALERGANIVVGTPGRLRDHIERGSLDTSALKAVVLDEADEMLDLGFREDLEFILDAAPAERRTLMFSATVPRQIANLAKRYQKDAERITTNQEREQHHDIEYRALVAAPNDRENAIINILRHADARSAIVFCATRATVNHMTSRFTNRGFSVVALSGELSQNERTHALQALRDGRARICIATDVAARGIDLPNLELVIHADLPKNPESLLHRSGRTGRAGRKGVSTLIVPHHRRRYMERILASANITANWGKPPSAEEIIARDRERVLEDEALSGEMTEEEKAFASELLTRHAPEQIAAAFLRQHMAGLTAPEELLDAAPEPAKRTRREDFKDGVWFRLSVGRERNAEPRWLLPMMCRFGKLTKGEIGAIRIQRNESYVELTAASADRFLETIGPSRKLENSITVTRVDGPPAETEKAPPRRRADNPRHDDKPPRAPRPPRTEARPEVSANEAAPEPSIEPAPKPAAKPEAAAKPAQEVTPDPKPASKPEAKSRAPRARVSHPDSNPPQGQTRKQRRQGMARQSPPTAPSLSTTPPANDMPGQPAIVKERMLGLAKPASDTEAPAAGDGAGGEARPKRGQGFAKKRRAAPGTEKPKKKKLNKKAKLRKLKAAMAPKGKAKSPQG
jgi:ATP-dependent RNA helicase DeaD